MARAPQGKPCAPCAGGWSLGWGGGGTGSTGRCAFFTLSPVALLAPLGAPPPAPRTQVTVGAQMLRSTCGAALDRDRRQLTRESLPPAALPFGRGQGHVRTKPGKIHAPSGELPIENRA